jgi:hypothetical protein
MIEIHQNYLKPFSIHVINRMFLGNLVEVKLVQSTSNNNEAYTNKLTELFYKNDDGKFCSVVTRSVNHNISGRINGDDTHGEATIFEILKKLHYAVTECIKNGDDGSVAHVKIETLNAVNNVVKKSEFFNHNICDSKEPLLEILQKACEFYKVDFDSLKSPDGKQVQKGIKSLKGEARAINN